MDPDAAPPGEDAPPGEEAPPGAVTDKVRGCFLFFFFFFFFVYRMKFLFFFFFFLCVSHENQWTHLFLRYGENIDLVYSCIFWHSLLARNKIYLVSNTQIL